LLAVTNISLVSFAGASFAAPGQGGLDYGRLAAAQTGDSFVLEDGRTVRLAGLDAPLPPIGQAAGQILWQEAREQLQNTLAGKDLTFVDRVPDRFGRVRAHVLVGTERLWAQEELLATGFARVRTSAEDFARAGTMLRLEEGARNIAKNIWQQPFYKVRTPKDMEASFGSFQIVEGLVVEVVNGRSHTYLNFGSNWRQDFTAKANKKVARLFVRAGIDLSGLSGVQVRVRGLVQPENGSLIELEHPSQLERLPRV